MSFEFRHFDALGNRIQMSMPLDKDGYFGRECPQPKCEGYFKVKLGTGLKGPNLPCHCPYCGHTDPHDRFATKEQAEYATSVALRMITQALQKDLKTLETPNKPSRGFSIGIKVQPGPPVPIRYYREKALETHVTCDSCTLEYAVFGVFGFCPDCRQHNSLTILSRNLVLTRKELDLAGTLPDPGLRNHLIEDALENCLSAFDAFAREACRVRSSRSADPPKAESLSFQNLPRVANRLKALFGIDFVKAVTTADWAAAHLGFMRRHLIAHRAGVVDQQYLDETQEPSTLLGRRIVIAPPSVAALADTVERLGSILVGLLPPPS